MKMGTGDPNIDSARRELERLRDSETRYRRLFETAQDGILILDGKTGRIKDVNPFLMDLLGYSKEAFLGKHLWDIGPFKDVAASRAVLRELQENDYFCYEDLLLQTYTGKQVEVEFVSNVYKVDHKKVIQCNIRDITKRKRAERELGQAHELLETVTQGTEVIIAALDTNYRYLYFNKAYAEEIRRLTAKELSIGASIVELFAHMPEQQKIALQEWSRTLSGDRSERTIEFGDPGSYHRIYRVLHTPLRDAAGNIVGAGEVASDVTDQARAEEALSLRLLLREYAISHSMEELLQRTIDVSEQLTSSRIGFFHTLDTDQKTLTLQAWSTNTLENNCTAEGQGAHYPVEQAGVWVDCILQRRPVIHNDYASLPNRKSMPEGHAQIIRELVVPIFRDELIVAVLGVGNKPVDYNEIDVQTVSELANLAWDLISNKLVEEQNKILARFPAENPNPVMRIARDGKLLYANKASQPLLDVWGCESGQLLPQTWRDLVSEALSTEKGKTTDIQCDGIIYTVMFAPVTGAGYVNLYGRDVTEQVSATGALQKARDELEKRVQERTQTLEITIEQLHTEVFERTQAEEALRSVYAYNRSLIDASLDPLVTITPDGKIGDVNLATELVTGYAREELIGTDFHSYFTDPHKARSGYQQVFERGAVRDYELEIRHKDGHITPVLYNAAVYRDESRAVAGIFAAARDITQRKQAEQELQQQEALLRAMMENLPVGVWITDATGKILQGNPAGQSIWAGARYVGIEEFGEYRAWWVSNGKLIMPDEWAVARAVRKGETSINEEIEIECFDGTHKIILNSAIPLRNAQQVIMGTIIVNQDITEIKRAQQELDADRQGLLLLSQSERAQRLFAESLAQTMLILNSTLNLNEVLDSILEQIQTVIPFRSANVALLEDERVRMMRLRGSEDFPEGLNILQDSFHQQALPLWERLSGSRHVLLIDDLNSEPVALSLPGYAWARAYLGAALQSGTNVVGFINLFSDQPGFFSQEAANRLAAFASQAALAIQNARLYRDLERALAQEQSTRSQLVQSEKFAAMGRMLASVAHELNNPLQTIQNCLYLTQQDTPAGSPIQEYLDMAFSEIKRLSRMVAQLRELYRPRSAMVVRSNNLCQILDEAHALLAPHLQNQQVPWEQGPGPEILIVNCDADQIKQVFINIGMNAIEAMQPDGGILSVQVIRSEDGRQAGVIFRDTGPGIPPEILQNLFEPFFTTKSSGLGLGLSICYELVLRHNGKITAESQVNVGSVFTVWLPLAEDQNGTNA
jgi:PAS domain S-box-containing protein